MPGEAALAVTQANPVGGIDGPLLTLVETIEALSHARSIDQIAAIVRSAARRITGADGVAFVLRDDDKCWYLDEDAIGPLWKGRKFPMTACISGWAMMNGQTAVIPDIYLDPRIPHDAYRPTFVKSLVMTPVRPTEPIAAIGAYWATVRDPTAEEITNLQVMARATAAALESARMYATLSETLERRKFLLRELDHRCKNTLAAVQSIADQTLRTAASPEAFNQAFEQRLTALSRSHELLTEGGWGNTKMRDILKVVFEPLAGLEGRFSMDGPDLDLRPENAVALHMTFHELAVNALLHGALSTPAGRVDLRWRVDLAAPKRYMELVWKESGGPPVVQPTRTGFGRRLIERGLARDLDGQARLLFEPDGVRFVLHAPLSKKLVLG